MRVSVHARKRAQQRGITGDELLLIATYGEVMDRRGGALRLRVPDRTINRLMRALDNCRRKILITDNDYQTIITAYALAK